MYVYIYIYVYIYMKRRQNDLFRDNAMTKLGGCPLSISYDMYIYIYIHIYVPSYIGDGHPTFNRNPYNRYISPY